MEPDPIIHIPEFDGGVQEARVIGPPGCGKSTWLRRQVQRAVERGNTVVVSSLTKAAALELAGRDMPLPPRNTGTLHSLCFHALGKPELAQLKRALADWNHSYPYYALTPVDEGLTEGFAGDMSKQLQSRPGDALMREYEVHRARMTTHQGLSLRLQVFVEEWSRWKKSNGLLDFTDLIEVCLRDVAAAPGNPSVIFIDEAQDLGTLEWHLVRKWGRSAGYLVVVGDPDQAIYDWRGADPEIFLDPTVADSHQVTLRQSYRVPIQVHAEAVSWIGRILDRDFVDYWPRPEEGQVRRATSNWKAPEGVITEAKLHLADGKKVMFIASCSFMLVNITRQLQDAGVPFHNPYRLQAREWNPLTVKRKGVPSWLDRIRAFLRPSRTGVWTAKDIRLWTEALGIKMAPTESGSGMYNTSDSDDVALPLDVVRLMIPDQALDAASVGDLEWLRLHIGPGEIQSSRYPLAVAMHAGPDALWTPPNAVVGTIHSVKGAEADVVYLFPDLSRSGMRQWKGGHVERARVIRVFYVAMTRAKETLVLCEPGTRKSIRC